MKRHIFGTDNKSIFKEQEILISFMFCQVVKKNKKNKTTKYLCFRARQLSASIEI